MIARDKYRAIQKILDVDFDGIPGPKTDAAYAALRATARDEYAEQVAAIKSAASNSGFLTGAGWAFAVQVDGLDLVIHNGICTAFGGASDRMDSGATASGLSTKDNPTFLGCALPMRREASSALRGSPIPKLPWRTKVVFSDGKKSVETELIDEGPARWTGHSGDLTVSAAQVFDAHATSNNFLKTLEIRIIGAAKFLTL